MDVNFNYGIFINVGRYQSVPSSSELTIIIKEKIGDRLLFKSSADNILQDNWFLYHEKFFSDAVVEIWTFDSEMGMYMVDSHTYNPRGKYVRIDLHYENRYEGQNWVKVAKQFGERWNCNLIFGVNAPDLDKFRQLFPKLEFVGIEHKTETTYASYSIGRFELSEDRRNEVYYKSQFPGWNVWQWWRYSRSFSNPSDWRFLHSEDIAKDILGLGTSRKFKYESIDCDFFTSYQMSNIIQEKIE